MSPLITYLDFPLHSVHSFFLLLKRFLQFTGNFFFFSNLFHTKKIVSGYEFLLLKITYSQFSSMKYVVIAYENGCFKIK